MKMVFQMKKPRLNFEINGGKKSVSTLKEIFHTEDE